MRGHSDPRFDASDEAQDFPQPRDGGTALEIAAGDAIFFDGYLLHRSLPNRSAASLRRAYVCHYMNARSLLPWNHDGASPTEDFRDIELVAGTDPYAWKGIADLSRPVRPRRAALLMLDLQRSKTPAFFLLVTCLHRRSASRWRCRSRCSAGCWRPATG